MRAFAFQLDTMKVDPSLQQAVDGGGPIPSMDEPLLPRLWPVLSAQGAVGIGAVALAAASASVWAFRQSRPPGFHARRGRAFLLVSPWQLICPPWGC